MKQKLFIRWWSTLVAFFFFLSTINLKIVLHSHDNTHLQNQETRWPIFNWIYLPLQCKFASFIMKYFLCSKYYGLCNYVCIPASLVVLVPRIRGFNIKKRPDNPSFLVLQMRKLKQNLICPAVTWWQCHLLKNPAFYQVLGSFPQLLTAVLFFSQDWGSNTTESLHFTFQIKR